MYWFARISEYLLIVIVIVVNFTIAVFVHIDVWFIIIQRIASFVHMVYMFVTESVCVCVFRVCACVCVFLLRVCTCAHVCVCARAS